MYVVENVEVEKRLEVVNKVEVVNRVETVDRVEITVDFKISVDVEFPVVVRLAALVWEWVDEIECEAPGDVAGAMYTKSDVTPTIIRMPTSTTLTSIEIPFRALPTRPRIIVWSFGLLPDRTSRRICSSISTNIRVLFL